MSDRRIRRALISVYDKTGIVEFARALHGEFGIEIISTGGTARLLRDNNIPVTLVEEITGFPEMLDGRVKTLHPKIHAAILADRDNPEHMRQLAEQGIEPIDMVVVNLYPFEETIRKPGVTCEEAIEMIDIGGPCLLRAAAKNHKDVIVIASAEQQQYVMEQLRARHGVLPYDDRLGLMCSVFESTSHYDLGIYRDYSTFMEWLAHRLAEKHATEAPEAPVPAFALMSLRRIDRLRYGENPHQIASLWCVAHATGLDHRRFELTDEPDLVSGEVLGGEDLSFNNYADADSALSQCAELSRAFDGCVAVFVKHTNPCGIGITEDPTEAYRRAYLGDPSAAMGGVLAVNFEVDQKFADAVMQSLPTWGKEAGAGAFFVEVWIAPGFTGDAIQQIQSARAWGKRVRLLAVGNMHEPPDANEFDLKRIAGGVLVQSRDLIGLNEEQWRVVTKRSPTDAEMADLRLAWLVAKHTKSNAISICRDGMLIGNGAGQMSRVMSCRIATWLANENGHADKLAGSAAASDAFFPFRDGPDLLLEAGVTAIIQPGGSKRDADTIAACDERGAAMIFTGTRHFKH